MECIRENEIYVLHNVLSKDECLNIIKPITFTKQYTNDAIRNNIRIMFKDDDLSSFLFEKIKNNIPFSITNEDDSHSYVSNEKETSSKWIPTSLNENFRILKYDEGTYFTPHYDASYTRNKKEQSFISIVFYLSDDFEGGETRFHNSCFPDGYLDIVPKLGSALLFKHKNWFHEGCIVKKGCKYVLRSDIVYKNE